MKSIIKKGKHTFLGIVSLLWLCCSTVHAQSSATLQAFSSFFKESMTTYDGRFPIYVDQQNYYLEIRPEVFGKEIMIIGDSPVAAGQIAKSSGFVRLERGEKNNINIIRTAPYEITIDPSNPKLVDLVSASNQLPVSSVIPAIAEGKEKGSLIINLTTMLMSGGEFLSFQNFHRLNKPDAARTVVESVQNDANQAIFRIRWSQTDINPSNGSENTSTNQVFLGFFYNWGEQALALREADPRIGFRSFRKVDYSKIKYYARRIEIINRWDIRVSENDKKSYAKGKLVKPEQAITVILDAAIPNVFKQAVSEGILAWNTAFEAAGFTNVLKLGHEEDLNLAMMRPQTILVRWGNTSATAPTATIVNPTTGRIVAGKVNISEIVSDQLLMGYYSQFALTDERIQKNLYDIGVRSDLLRYRVTQQLGEILGLLPNYAASAAYTTAQARNASWVRENGFSSSVTDPTFNFVIQKDDPVTYKNFLPKIGPYDKLAIQWAYQDPIRTFDESIFLKDGKINPTYYYSSQEKNNPWTVDQGLASDRITAIKLGVENLKKLYPQLEKLTETQKGLSTDWSDYLLLGNAIKQTYKNYLLQLTSIIGGKSTLSVRKGYNDKYAWYSSPQEQREALDLLIAYSFSEIPDWIRDERGQRTNGSSSETFMQLMNAELLRALLQPAILDELSNQENNNFTINDLFSKLDEGIFLDFSMENPIKTSYQRTLQFNYLQQIVQLGKNNPVESGLSKFKGFLDVYLEKTFDRILSLSTQHQDELTKDHYDVLRIYIKNNYEKAKSN